ncbi:hypothetical protein QOM21_04625 [Streptomyces sp. Pv4-95]|uniref:hypothetical protein n=1 Tax=Streptomyces sp. Pv4-95 TaxID=3049543 RepID=UPI003892B7D0
MTQTQTRRRTEARALTGRMVGVVADGVVKVLIGAAFIVGAARLGQLLGAPAWLMVVSGVSLLIGGGAEIRYVRSRAMRTYTRLMVAYDSGWALVTLAGLLVTWQGTGAGGEMWLGYQAAASLALAVSLVVAAPVRTTADSGAEDSAR